MPHALKLDLDVVLPDAHGEHDSCVNDLLVALASTSGVHDAHLVHSASDGTAQVCIDVDPSQVSLRRLADKARSVGSQIADRYGHSLWQLADVSHPSRAENSGAILRRIPGVVDATVAVGGIARLEFDRRSTDDATMRAAAGTLGITVVPVGAGGAEVAVAEAELVADQRPTGPIGEDDHAAGHRAAPHDHEGDPPPHDHDDHSDDDGHSHTHGGGKSELVIAVAAFAVYMVARIMDWTTDSSWVQPLYIGTAVVMGVMVGRDVYFTLRARRFDIDVLMFVAAGGAAVLGHWSDSALLLVLFSLGHSLEGYAMGRARRAIEALAELTPPTARRRSADGGIDEVPVEELAAGDTMVVRPNDRIAADGVVIDGTSSVDEAPVTGESVPVDKSPATGSDLDVPFDRVPRSARVFSGTLNGPGALEVRVARPASDSTLARVVTMVAEAETQVSPTQVLTDRIVKVFVPSVLALVAVLIVVPPLLGEAFSESFMRAMAVLVAASPCALAIATPSAVLAAIARAAKGGVLVKGGGPLEDLGRVQTIAFDKTGTLTEGRPRLVEVRPAEGVQVRDLLGFAVAVERLSDHPLATAITNDAARFAEDLPALDAIDVRAVIGKGVTATVDGAPVEIGNAALFDRDIPEELAAAKGELEHSGATTMVVRRDGRFLGVLGMMDTPRSDAAPALEALRRAGITRTVMLSGDHQVVADAVAAQVGITEARGGLLPEDKVAAVRELAGAGRGIVAMVGDGVNDAPAMATANVGVAMGAAGSDVALETADIALMADGLDRLPFAVELARRASRVIRQNLFFSLGVVAVLIPLTIAGVGIGPAVIAHEGSTLVVVANALLLLGFKDRTVPPGRR